MPVLHQLDIHIDIFNALYRYLYEGSSLLLYLHCSRSSCNDLRLHGHQSGRDDYKDGFYMLKNNLPVFCDMTTTPNEGWTLLVTAASSGWSKDQVRPTVIILRVSNMQYPKEV